MDAWKGHGSSHLTKCGETHAIGTHTNTHTHTQHARVIHILECQVALAIVRGRTTGSDAEAQHTITGGVTGQLPPQTAGGWLTGTDGDRAGDVEAIVFVTHSQKQDGMIDAQSVTQPPSRESKLARGAPCARGMCVGKYWADGRDASHVHSFAVVPRGRNSRMERISETLLQVRTEL